MCWRGRGRYDDRAPDVGRPAAPGQPRRVGGGADRGARRAARRHAPRDRLGQHEAARPALMALPRFLTAREVAESLNISYDGALRLMRAAGAVKVGELVRVSEEALLSHLDQCRERKPALGCTSAPGATSGT